jgi:hypothetical protein
VRAQALSPATTLNSDRSGRAERVEKNRSDALSLNTTPTASRLLLDCCTLPSEAPLLAIANRNHVSLI